MKRTIRQAPDVLGPLVAERQKYEQWIAALEAKKGSTPPRVYDRVHADYTTRLEGVMAELGARSVELESQRTTLKAQSEELNGEETALREERAEAELRNLVGEYTPEQWKEMGGSSEDRIGKLSAERGRVDAELAHIERILASIADPSSSAPGRGGSSTGPGDSIARKAPLPPSSEKAGETSAPPVPSTAVSAELPKRAVPKSGALDAVASPVPASPVAASGTSANSATSASPASAPRSQPTPGSSAAAPSSPALPPASGGAPRRSGFDDLAFLKSMEGEAGTDASAARGGKKDRKQNASQPDLGVVDPGGRSPGGDSARAPSQSNSAGLGSGAPKSDVMGSGATGTSDRSASADGTASTRSGMAAPAPAPAAGTSAAPPAERQVPPSNNAVEGTPEPKPVPRSDPPSPRVPGAPLRSSRQVSANDIGALGIENLSESVQSKNETPAFLKNVPAQQTKSLKCSECGAANYATEWYCERCGSELSAL